MKLQSEWNPGKKAGDLISELKNKLPVHSKIFIHVLPIPSFISILSYPTNNTCSNSTIEILKKGLKHI